MHYWVNTRVEKKDRVQLKDTRHSAMFGDVQAGNSDKSTNQHCGEVLQGEQCCYAWELLTPLPYNV